MANTCITRYVIYTRENEEALKAVRRYIVDGDPFDFKGKRINLYGDYGEEVYPVERAAHGCFFWFAVETADVPCNDFIEALLEPYKDIYYLYLTEDFIDLYRTNDVGRFYITEAWFIDCTLDKRIVAKRPELGFINDDVYGYVDEGEGRGFLQRILNTEETAPAILIAMLEVWSRRMQETFPGTTIDLYAKHIDYDYDKPAAMNIW